MSRERVDLMEYPETIEKFFEPYKNEYGSARLLVSEKIIKNELFKQIETVPKNSLRSVKCNEIGKGCTCLQGSKKTRSFYDIRLLHDGISYKTKLKIKDHIMGCEKDRDKRFPPDCSDVIADHSQACTKRLEEALLELSLRYSFRKLDNEFGISYKSISKIFDLETEYLDHLDNIPDIKPSTLYITEISYGSRNRKKALCIFNFDDLQLLEIIDTPENCFSIEEVRKRLGMSSYYKNVNTTELKRILFSINPGVYEEELFKYGTLIGKKEIDIVPYFNKWLRDNYYVVLSGVVAQLKHWEKISADKTFQDSLEKSGGDLLKVLHDPKNNSNEYRFALELIEKYFSITKCTDVDEMADEMSDCLNFIDSSNNGANILFANMRRLSDEFNEMKSFYGHFAKACSEEDLSKMAKVDETALKITSSNEGCSFSQIRKKLLYSNEYIVMKRHVADDKESDYVELKVYGDKTVKLYQFNTSILRRPDIRKYNNIKDYLPLNCINHMLDRGILNMNSEESFGICGVQERINEYIRLRAFMKCDDILTEQYLGRYYNTCIFGGPCIEMREEAGAFAAETAERLKKDWQ